MDVFDKSSDEEVEDGHEDTTLLQGEIGSSALLLLGVRNRFGRVVCLGDLQQSSALLNPAWDCLRGLTLTDLKCKQETIDVPSLIWGSLYLENSYRMLTKKIQCTAKFKN